MAKSNIVSATHLVRRFGDYARAALAEPVQIAQHGQIRLALVNADLIDTLGVSEADDPERLGVRFEILFDAIPTMVTLVDNNAMIVRNNAAARRYFELADDQAEGRPLATLLSPPENRTIPAAVLRVVATGQVEDFFVDAKRYAGRMLHVRVTPFPGGAALMADDVTATVSIVRNDAMRAALEAALDAAGVGEGTINQRGVIEHASPTLEQLTGANGERLANVRLSSLFSVRDRDAVIALTERALGKVEVGALECELLTEQGPLRVCLSIAPIEAHDAGMHAAFLVRSV